MTLIPSDSLDTTITAKSLAGALLLLGSAFFFTSCASVSAPSVPAAQATDRINWPVDYEPSKATFFVHNEIEISAPPEIVWDILVRAEDWPAWYYGATDVSVKNGAADGRLAANSVLEWKTMGLRFESRVRELVAPARLSWESRKSTITGYHAWLIVPTATGCRVITDEAQHGFLAVMQKIFIPQKLRRLHDVWLGELKKKAEARVGLSPSGSPPVSAL